METALIKTLIEIPTKGFIYKNDEKPSNNYLSKST